MANPTFLLITYHPKQPYAIYCDQQSVVSQHAKRFSAKSAPTIHNTLSNKNRIKDNKRRSGYSKRHSDATSDTKNPSRNLNDKT